MNELALLFTKQADGRPVVDSRIVADRFGKRHDNVIRDIRAIIEQAPEAALNFEEGAYAHPNTGTQQHPCYLVTRDGFSLLAMGFTGAAALTWKLRFIEAFNQLEAQADKPLTPAELILRQAQQLVDIERRQRLVEAQQSAVLGIANEARELAAIAEAKAQASTVACADFTVLAYANLHSIALTLTDANKLGRLCAHMSRERGLPIGKAADPRWGQVNTYMTTVLHDVFEEWCA